MPTHDPNKTLEHVPNTPHTQPSDPPHALTPSEGIDPDIDLHVARERDELLHTVKILGVIALGGMIGAAGRYLLSAAWPTPTDGFPWATFTINISGCFALGTLMAFIDGRQQIHLLTRPFFSTGIISGYTTFSTYILDANTLLQHHHPLLGLSYLWTSVVVGLAAVLVGQTVIARIDNAPAAPA